MYSFLSLSGFQRVSFCHTPLSSARGCFLRFRLFDRLRKPERVLEDLCRPLFCDFDFSACAVYFARVLVSKVSAYSQPHALPPALSAFRNGLRRCIGDRHSVDVFLICSRDRDSDDVIAFCPCDRALVSDRRVIALNRDCCGFVCRCCCNCVRLSCRCRCVADCLSVKLRCQSQRPNRQRREGLD